MFWSIGIHKNSCLLCSCIVLHVSLKLVFNWLIFGLDFTKWSSKHVVVWASKCFSENWPKRLSFDKFNSWFELGGKSGKPRFWLLRSSEGFHARASTFVFWISARATECWLERRLQALRFLQKQKHARATRRALERRTVSHAQASIEWRISTTSTFCIFTDRSSEEVYAQATPLFW